MNDRQHEDRLVYKHDDDDLSIPPQRADGMPATQEPRHSSQEPRHGGVLPERRDGLDDGRRGDLDDDDTPTVIAGRPAGLPVPGQAAAHADRSDPADTGHTGHTADAAHTPDVTHGADTIGGPLFDHDSEQVRRRWQEVQAGFVDDPRDSVERADSLVGEITTSLRTALEARTAELQGRWKNNDHNDTEQLRTALRDYRATLEQLLTLTSGTR
ncbi:hypothetical protein [Streptosporangium sp. NPDC003464]